MKTTNVHELNKKFKNCPVQSTEFNIKGVKYTVVSHFTGQKDLDKIIKKYAYSQAMADVMKR